MKNLFLVLVMFLSLQAYADITAVEAVSQQPTQAVIASNRACFSSLATLGCGDPADDIAHFRSCLNNVFPDLKKSCQNLMSDLYLSK